MAIGSDRPSCLLLLKRTLQPGTRVRPGFREEPWSELYTEAINDFLLCDRAAAPSVFIAASHYSGVLAAGKPQPVTVVAPTPAVLSRRTRSECRQRARDGELLDRPLSSSHNPGRRILNCVAQPGLGGRLRRSSRQHHSCSIWQRMVEDHARP